MTQLPQKNPDFRHDIQFPNPFELPYRLIPTDVIVGRPGSRFCRKFSTSGVTPTERARHISVGYITKDIERHPFLLEKQTKLTKAHCFCPLTLGARRDSCTFLLLYEGVAGES